MEDTAKLEIHLPLALATYTREMARRAKTSQSEIIAQCIEEKRLNDFLAEGYQAMADENLKFANTAFEAGAETFRR
jgi:hypothetical protein